MIINKTSEEFTTQLVKKVLYKTSNKKEYGLDKDVVIVDDDLDRVYLECNNKTFAIRMWNIEDINNKHSRIRWTLFVDVPNEDGSSHGEELSYGMSIVKFE